MELVEKNEIVVDVGGRISRCKQNKRMNEMPDREFIKYEDIRVEG
jgi:hypothetical protein